jgi:YggT family protein
MVTSVLDYAYSIYQYMIIGYILLSWVPSARDSALGRLLGRLVEPYLGVFRRFIPPIGGMLDLSPIVALFALRFVVLGLESVLSTLLP